MMQVWADFEQTSTGNDSGPVSKLKNSTLTHMICEHGYYFSQYYAVRLVVATVMITTDTLLQTQILYVIVLN